MAQVKLEEVVSSFLLTNDLGKAEYSKLYQIGIKGIRDLSMDATGQAKRYDIHLDRSLSGDLPSDFINDTKVFVKGDQGAGLLKDNTLGNEEEYDEEVFEGCHDHIDFGDMDFDREPKYGEAGIDWIGRYKIDRGRSKLYVNPDFCYSCVTLEYLGRPTVTAAGEWLLDDIEVEAVEAYMRWKYNLDKRSVGPYEKRLYEQQYKKERRKARTRAKNITRGQLQHYSRVGVKFKVKS